MKGFKGTPGPYTVEAYMDEPRLDTIWSDEVLIAKTCYALASKDNAKLLGASYDLASALKELIFLHGCEQEGISSGQPTRKQWLKAYNDGVNALEKAGIDLSEI